MNAVILFIIGIPLIEIYLIIKVGGVIGAINTIFLIFFTAITGVYFARIAGLNETKYSGHSLRSGFATATAQSGAEERDIMSMTGHKTTQMVRRYIKDANIFKNNALNKIKI